MSASASTKSDSISNLSRTGLSENDLYDKSHRALNQLVSNVIEASALILTNVRLRRSVGGRESVKVETVCLRSPACKGNIRVPAYADHKMLKDNMDFYLLFDGVLSRVKLTSQAKTATQMVAQDTAYKIWDVQVADLMDIAKQDWTDRLLVAQLTGMREIQIASTNESK